MGRITYRRPGANGTFETDKTSTPVAYAGLPKPAGTSSDAPKKSTLTKEEVTVAAVAALSGFAVNRLADSGYAVSKWNLFRHCETLEDVRAMLIRAGVAV